MSIELEKHSYNEGRKAAYADILGWLVTHSNGEIKSLPIQTFIPYLQDKLAECQSYNPAEDPSDEAPHAQYDASKLGFGGLKITDRIKRVSPKGATEENGTVHMEDTEGNNRKIYSFKKKRIDFDYYK